MADQVHSRDSPPSPENSVTSGARPPSPLPVKTAPSPGTYVVQVPKDQIYRYPPPENPRRSRSIGARKRRRGCCCRCLCVTLCFFVALLFALAIAAGVFYLVFRPESPNYTVSSVAIKGLNATSESPISPEFDVTVRSENPNDKIGIYYRRGSSVTIFYSGVELGYGELPAFFQPAVNVTNVHVELKRSEIMLSNAVKSSLIYQQRQQQLNFKLNIKSPVKIKVGAVKTWEITAKVNCDVTVNALNDKPNILSKSCSYSFKLW
ncbi:unnamed protein product [Cuscuta europaea]|uniref:Late embryogenesis abundant protein LEA-2 subgroup domain-containing protein n=1 Tax=Cuscuta europaea TaxID=41803 RepID=A0A9P0YR35_CUSEU|nr:unnamed protein product [Cuscuta europaea]